MYLTNVSIDYIKKRYTRRRQQKDKRNISCCMHIKTNMDIGCGIMWALQREREGEGEGGLCHSKCDDTVETVWSFHGAILSCLVLYGLSRKTLKNQTQKK